MIPCNIGGHAAYQDFILSEIFHLYPDPFALSKDSWKIILEFWHLDLSLAVSLLAMSLVLVPFMTFSHACWTLIPIISPLRKGISDLQNCQYSIFNLHCNLIYLIPRTYIHTIGSRQSIL